MLAGATARAGSFTAVAVASSGGKKLLTSLIGWTDSDRHARADGPQVDRSQDEGSSGRPIALAGITVAATAGAWAWRRRRKHCAITPPTAATSAAFEVTGAEHHSSTSSTSTCDASSPGGALQSKDTTIAGIDSPEAVHAHSMHLRGNASKPQLPPSGPVSPLPRKGGKGSPPPLPPCVRGSPLPAGSKGSPTLCKGSSPRSRGKAPPLPPSGKASPLSGKGSPSPGRKGPAIPPWGKGSPAGCKGSPKGSPIYGKGSPPQWKGSPKGTTSGKGSPGVAASQLTGKVGGPTFGRRLHWQTLNTVDGTIFEKLGTDAEIKADLNAPCVDVLKHVFDTQSSMSRTSSNRPSFTPKSQGKELLDRSRAQQLAITFNGSKVNVDELICALQELDFGLPIEDEDVERLLQVWPTAGEMKLVSGYCGKDELRDIEKFVKRLAGVPRSGPRLRAVRLARSLEAVQESVRQRITISRSACEELLKSNAWKLVLAEALKLGNYFNHGSSSSGAKGISIEALLQLRNLKGPGGTALHCLCINLAHQDDGFCAKLHAELSSVPRAAQMSLSALREMISRLGEDIAILAREIGEYRAEYNVSINTSSAPVNRRNVRRGTCKAAKTSDSSTSTSMTSTAEGELAVRAEVAQTGPSAIAGCDQISEHPKASMSPRATRVLSETQNSIDEGSEASSPNSKSRTSTEYTKLAAVPFLCLQPLPSECLQTEVDAFFKAAGPGSCDVLTPSTLATERTVTQAVQEPFDLTVQEEISAKLFAASQERQRRSTSPRDSRPATTTALVLDVFATFNTPRGRVSDRVVLGPDRGPTRNVPALELSAISSVGRVSSEEDEGARGRRHNTWDVAQVPTSSQRSPPPRSHRSVLSSSSTLADGPMQARGPWLPPLGLKQCAGPVVHPTPRSTLASARSLASCSSARGAGSARLSGISSPAASRGPRPTPRASSRLRTTAGRVEAQTVSRSSSPSSMSDLGTPHRYQASCGTSASSPSAPASHRSRTLPVTPSPRLAPAGAASTSALGSHGDVLHIFPHNGHIMMPRVLPGAWPSNQTSEARPRARRNSSCGDIPMPLPSPRRNSMPPAMDSLQEGTCNNPTVLVDQSGKTALKKLETLVSGAQVITRQLYDDIAGMSDAANKCESYFGANGGEALAAQGVGGGREGTQLFSGVGEFLSVFRAAWADVHRDERWRSFLPKRERSSSQSRTGDLRTRRHGGTPRRITWS